MATTVLSKLGWKHFGYAVQLWSNVSVVFFCEAISEVVMEGSQLALMRHDSLW